MATFGKTDIGGTANYVGTGRIRGARFTLTENGTVTKLTAYMRKWAEGGTINATCGIYDVDGSNDPNNLIGSSAEVANIDFNNPQWYDFTINAELTAGEYYLCMESSGHAAWYSDAGGERHWSAVRTYGDPWPDPFGSAGSDATAEYSIYATYTAASAGAGGAVGMHQVGHIISKIVRG